MKQLRKWQDASLGLKIWKPASRSAAPWWQSCQHQVKTSWRNGKITETHKKRQCTATSVRLCVLRRLRWGLCEYFWKPGQLSLMSCQPGFASRKPKWSYCLMFQRIRQAEQQKKKKRHAGQRGISCRFHLSPALWVCSIRSYTPSEFSRRVLLVWITWNKVD